MMNTMNIWYGTGENARFSNLAYRPFVDKTGRPYVSVEHAYQTWKSGKFHEGTYQKPWKAGVKFIGPKAKMDGGWNIWLMGKLICQSFIQNPIEASVLINTTCEFSHVQDKGIWRTEFPRILSEVREYLRPMGHSVIVAGSREGFRYEDTVKTIYESRWIIRRIISGLADGPDSFGRIFGLKNQIEVVEFPVTHADWKKHGRKAGMLRNEQMLEVASALITNWDGRSPGTANMREIAKKAGIPIFPKD